MRFIAVDWSGAARRASRRIWWAEMEGGELRMLESGRSRQEVAGELIAVAKSDPDTVVGLDFAFSFPAWFIREQGASSIRDFREIVESRGESWLEACDPPFWGRKGTVKPDHDGFRRTELHVAEQFSAQPKSVFQVGGAGAVGTGSIRGIPILARLAEAGFAIWPFDDPELPVVVEIYPRLLTGDVVKSDPRARLRYLADHFPGIGEEYRVLAASSEDAFDAAVSALVMWQHRRELSSMESARDEVERLEGRIWYPETENEEADEVTYRKRDSSKTRVAPVMNRVVEEQDWVRRLLALPRGGHASAKIKDGLDLTVQEQRWDPDEKPLAPPVALLSWLIRNLNVEPSHKDRSKTAERRRRLAGRDPETIADALRQLREGNASRGWHILEGPTYPDVFISTPDAVVVIEGKRTESKPTVDTTWMKGRPQMLRHMDGAWEIRGDRKVFGFFIVEGVDGSDEVPEVWLEAAESTTADSTLESSLPHRPEAEREAIAGGFLGVTTWRAVCDEFGIDYDDLPNEL